MGRKYSFLRSSRKKAFWQNCFGSYLASLHPPHPPPPVLVSCFPGLDVRERWGGSLPSWYAVLI